MRLGHEVSRRLATHRSSVRGYGHRYGAACTGHGELTIRRERRSVVAHMKMGLTAGGVNEAAADLRALVREFPAALTIHAINALGEPYVLAIGKEPGTGWYWYWAEGMPAAEKRNAVEVQW